MRLEVPFYLTVPLSLANSWSRVEPTHHICQWVFLVVAESASPFCRMGRSVGFQLCFTFKSGHIGRKDYYLTRWAFRLWRQGVDDVATWDFAKEEGGLKTQAGHTTLAYGMTFRHGSWARPRRECKSGPSLLSRFQQQTYRSKTCDDWNIGKKAYGNWKVGVVYAQ